MNKRNKYSHPHIYSLVYQPVSHTPTHTHTHTHTHTFNCHWLH